MAGSVSRRVLVGFVAIGVLLLANTLLSYHNISRLVREERWIEHTLKVRESMQVLLAAVNEAQASQRGYAITGADMFVENFEDAIVQVHDLQRRLRGLTADNASQQRRLDQQAPQLTSLIAWMQDVIEVRRNGDTNRALDLIASGHGALLMADVHDVHDKMLAEEDRLLVERHEAARHSLAFTIIGLVSFAAGSAFLIGVVFYFLRRDVQLHRRAEQALHAANHMLRLVLDHIPQRIFWKDPASRFLGANQPVAQDAGLTSWEELLGKRDDDLPWRAQAERYRNDDQEVLQSGAAKLGYEEPQLRPDGSTRHLRTNKVPMRDLDGRIVGVLGTYEDITDRKLTGQRLRLQASAIEASTNGIFIINIGAPGQPIEYANRAFERITGYAPEEVIGRNFRTLQNGDLTQEAPILAALEEGRSCAVTLRNHRKDGTLFWNYLQLAPVLDDGGTVTHYVGVFEDITERIEHVEELERLANFDAASGLPNRNRLVADLARAIECAAHHGSRVRVARVDLDHFKFLNDSYGHAFGDELLTEIGKRLRGAVGESDSVARLGEDEFALVLSDCGGEPVAAMAERIQREVAAPILLHGREVRITCSIGISIYPEDGPDGETLLRLADVAMYRAKEDGRNVYRLFRPDMTRRFEERVALEHAMHKALEEKEFLLHYQPQLDLRSGRIIGAEALIRWQHPQQGMIPPVRFIPLAEDSDLILPIGEWVLRTACAQAQAWRAAGLPAITMSVNVSVRQFRQEDFAGLVMRVLQETGLEPGCLELELTEGVLMAHVEELLEVLDRLRAAGVRLAVDDFGTGYSSLSYLKRLPLDKLKIDQSFIREIPRDQNDMAIARAVIMLSRSLDMQVIAEGVETAEQLAFLREHDCDEMQGYFFSKPVEADAFAALLAAGKGI